MAFDRDGNRLNNGSNDIDATGGTVDGVVEIITPDVDALQGMPQLSENPVESGQNIRQACQASGERLVNNSFTIKGKGGIPPEPVLPLDSHNIFINSDLTDPTSTIPEPIETSRGKIQPARGIVLTESGEIVLTAYRTNDSGERIPEGSINCGRV